MHARSSTPSVVLDDITYTWPDGSTALNGVSGAFSTARTGLVGRNGSGKSTLLRLIAASSGPIADSSRRQMSPTCPSS